mmetsp:Transcript_47584/g.78879  ORF Transcript_47584/g.78879 Transcript_47584/m.78879 type:complete len:119 (-) Transcript_47584:78-434(-)
MGACLPCLGGGGLKKEITKEGYGPRPEKGQFCKLRYQGMLTSGHVFDQSRDGFSFELGEGAVIKGWDILVAKMKLGEKAKLTIPPSYGYGSSGAAPAIPPNATLIFNVELIEINDTFY